MSKLKILMVTSAYPPSTYGGISSIAYELSKELADRGNEVTVITSRYSSIKNLETSNKLKTYYLLSPSIPPKDIHFCLFNLRKITGLADEISPDVVFDFSSAYGLFPWLSKTSPFVTTIHGSPQISRVRASMCSADDHLRSIAFRLAHVLPTKLMTSIIEPKVDSYVFVSRFCLEDMLKSIPRKEILGKTRVIYNGVDVDSLTTLKNKNDNVDEESMVFLGRLMEYKGIFCLLKAFKILFKDNRRAKLHIIGSGPLFLNIKNYVDKNSLTKNVCLHGSLPRTKALRILAKSMLLVHPSFYESFCMSIVEAFALGKPVIAHRAGYAFEMVKENRAGLLVNATIEEEFAASITSLLADSAMYKKLSASAEMTARERFDIKLTAVKYESLFKELIN